MAFMVWAQRTFAGTFKGGQIALDGKTARRSSDKAFEQSAVHMVSALACDYGLMLAPLLQAEARGGGPAWSAENLQRLATRVQRGPIRIQADEVTYPAHIVLRFQLEKQLLRGDLEVRDLRAAWNEGMQRLVGITPTNDAEGVLQDIHWYEGHFGYFPTYTLGALAAAQIFEAAISAPRIASALEEANFLPLRDWLHTHIHQHASLIDGPTLIERATGRPLHADAFQRHLRRRYLSDEG